MSLPPAKVRRHPPNAALSLPRRVERTVAYRAVQHHLATFLERAETSPHPVPRFVQRELERFLECGIPAHGFVRVRCHGCGHDRLVPFSCKGRGFCPSCGGRRMAEGAAHLVDHVLPLVPVRQWVLSLPFELRFRLAWDHELMSAVLGVTQRAVLGFQRERARRELGVPDGRCGAVTVVQRFGGSLNLNVHFHSVVLDGVHAVDERGDVRFWALDEPRASQLLQLTETIAQRVWRLLGRRGLLHGGDAEELPPGDTEPDPLLAACQAASVRRRIALGSRAGHRVRRLIGATERPDAWAGKARSVEGFDLHVGARVPARERKRLERLCRYVLRPPLSNGLLSEMEDGRLRYELRTPWSDGTTAVVFEPLEFVEKLVALIPRPRVNLIRYHGTLAPNAKLRALIVPVGSAERPKSSSCTPSGESARTSSSAARRIAWADLLRRVFATDVLECPRCSGRMRLVATVNRPEAVRAILECIGLPARPPPQSPAREPEQWELPG